MKYLSFFILLFIGELSVSAQHMFSRQFPFFNQLSSNEIFSIHQDRERYFWIGTWKGLNLYNKQTCRITPFSDARLLEKVDINHLVDTHMMYTRICKEREGNLWLPSYDMAYTIFCFALG